MLINRQNDGVFSIYDSCLSKNHVQVWDWITNSLPNADYILIDHFNMIEWEGDRDGC